jgi:hypothetical protein
MKAALAILAAPILALVCAGLLASALPPPSTGCTVLGADHD